jgi:hypothetical protein
MPTPAGTTAVLPSTALVQLETGMPSVGGGRAVIDRMSFHTNLHAPAEEGMPMTNVAAGMPAAASAARGGYGFNAPCFSRHRDSPGTWHTTRASLLK